MDRRAFLRRSGLGVGVGLATSQLTLVKKAKAADAPAGGDAKPVVRRTVCGHCSVGCAVDAVVENGVWTRQEPVFDSPINLGAHCAKGAALREHGHGDYRLKAPMKLVDGKYQKISWDQALNEISAKMLELKKASGPDSVFVVGSSKHNNEQAYLLRKWVSMWGSNNCDHQARICHSTTVAGVANTWGYGAMTNSYNDMRNSKAAMYIGSNAAEAHPVSMLHMLHAKETGTKMIVVDPRFTRTAAKADEYVRIRSGGDIPFLFGMLHHIFKNGWEDKKYIADRVYGMDKVRDEVLAKWTPDKVLGGLRRRRGRPCYKAAKTMAENRPSTIVWCMGQTQHTIGNAMVRASCILQLALGNIGVSGGGANIFRGHDNVQGATDVGPNPDSLPGYYGLAEGSWKHFAKVWGVDFEWIKKQYAPGMMAKPGMTVSRWIDGVLEKNELIDQDSNLRGLFFWGHAPNSQTRGLEMKTAMDKLDLLVVIDPYPSATAAMAAMPGKAGELNPNRAVYLLPAATQFETSGSVTASNRSIQWREKVIEPLFESRTDHMIMYQLAQKLGFDKELVGKTQDGRGQGRADGARDRVDPARDQPERLDHRLHRPVARAAEGAHAQHERLRREDAARQGRHRQGNRLQARRRLLRPAVAVLRHAGAEASGLAEPVRHHPPRDGRRRQLPRQLRRRDATASTCWPQDGSHSKGADITTGYPEFDHMLLKKLGWWNELTDAEKAAAEGKNWKTDLSGGIIRVTMKNHGVPPVRQRQGAGGGLELPRPDAAAPRAALFEPARPDRQVPDARRQEGVLAPADALQERAGEEHRHRQEVPADHDSAAAWSSTKAAARRRARTRGSPSCSRRCSSRSTRRRPTTAASATASRSGSTTPTGARIKVKALVTERVGRDTVFLPFHFSGRWQGVDMMPYYPEGAAPVVRGEAVNTATTYGYDSVTMMQETKTTLCQIERATA